MNRPLRACCEHPRLRRRSSPDRDASRGNRRATSCVGPFHRVPRRSSPSAEARWEPLAPIDRRARSSLPKLARQSTPILERALCCLSSQSERVDEPHRHPLGRPATPPAGACRNRGSRGLAPATARRWQATARDLNRAAPSVDRSRAWLPVAALAEGSSFPRERGETSRNDARDARAAPLRREARRRHVAKTTDTRCRFRGVAHLRRQERDIDRGRCGLNRDDPAPSSAATITRRSADMCFPENPPIEHARPASRTLAPRLSREGRPICVMPGVSSPKPRAGELGRGDGLATFRFARAGT